MAKRQHAGVSDIDRLLAETDPEIKSELVPLRRSLRSGNRDPEYIHHTLRMVRAFALWLQENDRGALRDATQFDVQDWLGELLDKFAVPTVISYRAAVRAYYTVLSKELKLRPDIPTEGIRLPEAPDSQKDIVSLPDLSRVLTGLDAEKRYLEAAVISVLVDTGMRVSELAAVRLEHMDHEADEPSIFIPAANAKNKHDRIVGYTDQTVVRLDRWFATRPDKDSPYLFTGQPDNGERKPFTRSGLYQLVSRMFRKFKVDGIGPHDLRHTWATHSLNHPEARETDVMAAGGWASTRMLSNYTHQGRQRRALRANRKTSPLAQM